MSRYKCPECGNVWTEGDWTEYTTDRYCSDGCRRRADEAEAARREASRPRSTCSWCGSEYYSSDGCTDAAGNEYCSHRCYYDALENPSVRAEVDAALEARRRRREEEARRQREEAARRAREEAEERARKADPNRWYPQEWVDYLKSNPSAASRCPWARLDIKASMWTGLLKVQPGLWDKCRAWRDFDISDWDSILDGLLRQSGFKSGVESRMNGSGWAVLLSKTLDYDAKCQWGSLSTSDWAWLLRTRSEFARTCPCWGRFDSGDWCTLLARKPLFWLRAWRCDWFSVDPSDWAKLPIYTAPLQVFMFVAGIVDRFLSGVGGLIVLAAVVLIVLAIVL